MKKIAFYTFLIFGVITTFSCERTENPDGEGPSLVDIYADFQFNEPLTFSQKSADFSSNQGITMYATFNKLAQWEMKITGLNSGAVKSFQGTSRQLDEANTFWNGSTTMLPIFQEEKCLFELHILDNDSIITDTLEITGVKSNNGILLESFESGDISPKASIFRMSGADMSFVVSNDTTAAQGEYYFDMAGAVNWDWFLGQLNLPADAYNYTTFPLAENPEIVYLNFMANYVDVGNPGFFLIQVQEDDNMDGQFEAGEEDFYEMRYPPEDGTFLSPGWQLVSLNFGDVNLENAEGNRIVEPHKIKHISFLYLANKDVGFSRVLLDYIIFTEGGALEP